MLPKHISGLRGMQCRIFDYKQYARLADLAGLDRFMTWSASVLPAGQLVFMLNFFYSLRFGRRAELNHWRAKTLEWTVDRPGRGNFEVRPTMYRRPYEHSFPGANND